MIQKGNRVYIVPNDSRQVPYYRTVKSISSKYITVDDHPSYNRFSVITHISVDDRMGWNPKLCLYESKEAYEKIIKKRDKWLNLYDKISKGLLQNASIEQLEQIYNILIYDSQKNS